MSGSRLIEEVFPEGSLEFWRQRSRKQEMLIDHWKTRAERAEAALAAEMPTTQEITQLYDRILELEKREVQPGAVQLWIPVSERLPESETVVIVYDRRTDKVYEGYLSSDAGGWCENTWWLRRLQNVTHWTPKVFPDAPKGGGA